MPETPKSTQVPSHSALPAHFPALDGVRGIAIALVLIHQLGDLEVASNLVEYLFRYLVGVGWAGVQLFFVLSGFLITGILLDTQRTTNYFSGFFARRTLRIFPLYFATLIVAFLLLPMTGADIPSLAQDREHQIWLWTYLENWATLFGQRSNTFPHYWSLAVEEQFYLIWPLFMWRRSAENCLRLCIVVAFASLLVRCIISWYGITSHDFYYFPSICRADALALGGALAAAMRLPRWREAIVAGRNKIVGVSVVIAVGGALVTRGYSITLGGPGQTIGYSIVALIFTLVVAVAAADDAAVDGGWRRVLRLRFLQVLGKYSYAMYILHKPFHDHVGRPLLAALGFNLRVSAAQNMAYIAVCTMAVFALAYASYHLFEKHFLRLKRLFAPAAPALT